MKRIAALMVTVAVLAGVTGARAHHECGDRGNSPPVGYKYCGEHPRLDDLPLQFKFNKNSAPGPIAGDDLKLTVALNQAMLEWNRYWPIVRGSICGEVLCNAGYTGIHTAALDGVNAIFFSETMSFPECAPKGTVVAVACVFYAGSSGAARHRIVEVDIALNADMNWYLPGVSLGASLAGDAPAVVVGEAAGFDPDLGNTEIFDMVGNGAGRFDFQSVITHELGHAIGFEDAGSSDPWPTAPQADAGFYQQTMYRYYYQGTTNKRTIADGDIAGLQRIAADMLLGI